ncbi:MAG: hypothetical protein WD669_03240 [Pirellulales bacterium]
MPRTLQSLGVVAIVLGTIAGCPTIGSNRSTANIGGGVTIGGQPIPENAQASITFGPTDVGQARSSSSPITNGKYSATDVPKGKVLVTFNIMQPTGEEKAFAPGARPQMEMRSLVPQAKANGVEVQIDGNQTDLNFNL